MLVATAQITEVLVLAVGVLRVVISHAVTALQISQGLVKESVEAVVALVVVTRRTCLGAVETKGGQIEEALVEKPEMPETHQLVVVVDEVEDPVAAVVVLTIAAEIVVTLFVPTLEPSEAQIAVGVKEVEGVVLAAEEVLVLGRT